MMGAQNRDRELALEWMKLYLYPIVFTSAKLFSFQSKSGGQLAMEFVSEPAEYRSLRISVVIPAYNEAKNLQHVLPMIPPWVHEVILSNNQSTDDTVAVARSILPTIRVVEARDGQGKGIALQAGFAAVTGDIIVMIDADGSSDPREMPRFIDALMQGAYFAKGSRFIGEGGSSDITPLRRFGSLFLIGITNRLFGVHFTDMFCGFNAFWRDCLDFFDVDCVGFEIEALLHLRICKANLDIVEVPSFEHSRIHGRSKFRTFRDGWRVLKMILQERVNGRKVIRTAKIAPVQLKKGIFWDGLAAKEQVGVMQ
jgi:glycosyltransferase involved in cell wall biosynthesis